MSDHPRTDAAKFRISFDRNSVIYRVSIPCYDGGEVVPAEVAADLEAENAGLKIALADAIRRPMGVIPNTAEGMLTRAELDAAEERRARLGGASLADAICKACIPGGQSCDPQQVADSIREFLGKGGAGE